MSASHCFRYMVLIILIDCLSVLFDASANATVTGNDHEYLRNGKSVYQMSNAENFKQGGGFRVELIHRDSPSSPFGHGNMTRVERLRRAVNESKARACSISKGTGVTSHAPGKSTLSAFSSPVSPDEGAYLMLLQLGTPPQTFHSIVDTGSDLVWVACQPCLLCSRQEDPLFNPAASSTYRMLPCLSHRCQQLSSNAICLSSCAYIYQYGDQSSTIGDFSTETVTLNSTSSKGGSKSIGGVAFGCGRMQMGTFGGAAGIVGLGQGPVSLTSQLASQIQNRFSYCLVSFDDAPSKTSPLLFGSAASLTASGTQSTPILNKGSTYYYVSVEGISVDGQHVRAARSSESDTIVDSGTTLTLFPNATYAAIRAAFEQAIDLPPGDGSSAGFDLCYNVEGLSSYTLPSFSLHLTNAEWKPPAQNYFILLDSSTLCLAMGSSGSLKLSILGNLLQQNYHVLYDRSSSTFSFAAAKCDQL